MLRNRCRCGRPPTYGNGSCLRCAAETTVDIPPNPERRANVPPSILTGGAWELARPAAVSNTLWLHQSRGLELLESGRNVVLSTPTASGKTLVFQLWAMTELIRSPESVILAFYPTKALANDQARRWRESCQALGLPNDTVEQIDGDVGLARREEIIRRARVVLATPDVTHAWLPRRAGDPLVKGFLRRLRGVIIDEAHAYEGVFGSNSAYLFRRLISAAAGAGNLDPPVRRRHLHYPGPRGTPPKTDRGRIPGGGPGHERHPPPPPGGAPPAPAGAAEVGGPAGRPGARHH